MKKLWNMKVTIVPIVIGAFGTVAKWLLKGLEDLEVGGRVETIQTTTLLRTARILRRVLETWGEFLSLKLQWKTLCHSNSSEKPSAIIPVGIGAFGTVAKWLLKGLEDLEVDGRVETIQTIALLRTAKILRRVLETWGDLLSLKFQWIAVNSR